MPAATPRVLVIGLDPYRVPGLERFPGQGRRRW
jgi:hypothetical protein